MMLPLPFPCMTRTSCFMLQDHAENVGLECRWQSFPQSGGDGADLPIRGGVIDCDIETAETRDGLVDHARTSVLLADVGVDELRLRTQ